METGFLNFHDEEHFSTMPSPLMYDQGEMLDDSESSLLDMIPEDFTRYSVRDPWDVDSEQELNGDMATLPGPISTEAIRSKEDFHKMLNEWQEHLGSMQTSDNDEIYDGIEPLAEHLPGMDIFDESSFDGDNISSNKKLDKTQTKKSNKLTGKKVVGKDLALGHFIQDESDEETDRLLILENNVTSIENNGGLATLEDSENMDDAFRIDVDDDCIDVETVSGNEQIPVLEAVDVTSLLEQFEASESVNTTSSLSKNQTELDNHLFAMATQRINANSLISTPKPSMTMSHQNIIDALPKEVIERIKASGRKKAIPVIPAMPSKKLGRAGTRMQDAGVALSRNKLLKIVSSGTVTGESIQLDHDYCSASNNSSPQSPDVVPMRSFYHSDPSDYGREEKPKPSKPIEKVYSRLPDYYLVMAPQIGITKKESDSRKDSGLESGDVSDASEELLSEKTSCTSKSVFSEVAKVKSSVSNSDSLKTFNSNKSATTVTTVRDKIVTINGKDINLGSIMQNVNKALGDGQIHIKNVLTKSNKDATMVSVLKRNSSLDDTVVKKEVEIKKEAVDDYVDVKDANEPKKRKLNLSEYRNRVKELDRCRDSCESSRASSPVTPDTPTLEEAKQIFEQATQMLINAKGQIDEESFAEMKKTLEKQAAMKMPAHESHQEEYRPRLIQTKVEKPVKKVQSPIEEKPVKKMQSPIEEKAISPRPIMEAKSAASKIQSPVIEGKLAKNLWTPVTGEISVVKAERPIVATGEPPVKVLKQFRTTSPVWVTPGEEINVVEMEIVDQLPLIESDNLELVNSQSTDNDLNLLIVDVRSLKNGSAFSNENYRPAIDDVCSSNNVSTTVEEVRLIAEICPEHFDIEPANPDNRYESVDVQSENEKRMSTSDEQRAADLLARRERNKNRESEDVGVANKSNRSRRQYRSHRTNSSSSSSSSNSHTSRRRPSEKTRTERLPPKSRSRSPSSSSSVSSRSRSSSHSKMMSRNWLSERRANNEYNQRNRRSGSNHSQKSHSSYRSNNSRRRSRSPKVRGPEYQLTEREKERQVEERRVIYVGRIDEGMTKVELRAHFETFGPIVDISVHFREHGDNYGFVTFAYKVDAYAAVEQGKKDPILGQYDLSFGGRRAFCKARYSDLDGSRQDDDGYGYSSQRAAPARQRPTNNVNFDDLLREALKKKKEVVKSKV